MRKWGAWSAVGGGAGCRLHPIPGSWFGFPAQANQAFHPSRVVELVPDLSGDDKALTRSSAGHRKPLGQIRIQSASTTSLRSRMRGASHK